MTKEYKAGFAGADSMRAKAEKMLKGMMDVSLKQKPSKSAVANEKPRPYKAGGSVKKAVGGRASVDTGSNAELSIASRDKAPMRGAGRGTGGVGAMKKGGCVKKAMGGLAKKEASIEGMKPVKLAAGGVGKFRKGEATAAGKPTKQPRKPRSNGM